MNGCFEEHGVSAVEQLAAETGREFERNVRNLHHDPLPT